METCSNYLLAFDWFIRNGIECCMRVGRVQNSDEKYLFRRLSVSGPVVQRVSDNINQIDNFPKSHQLAFDTIS